MLEENKIKVLQTTGRGAARLLQNVCRMLLAMQWERVLSMHAARMQLVMTEDAKVRWDQDSGWVGPQGIAHGLHGSAWVDPGQECRPRPCHALYVVSIYTTGPIVCLAAQLPTSGGGDRVGSATVTSSNCQSATSRQLR